MANVDEDSNKLGRVDKSVIGKSKKLRDEKNEKITQLLKQLNGRQSLMDFIFGKNSVNPLAPEKENNKG